MFGIRYRTKYVNKFNKGDLDCQSNQAFEILENRMGPMDFIYDNFYDRWRSCTISYTFGTLPDHIGAFRYISPLQVARVCLSTAVCRVAQILGVMCSLQTQN